MEETKKFEVSQEVLNNLQKEVESGTASPAAISLACALGIHNWGGTQKCKDCGKSKK